MDTALPVEPYLERIGVPPDSVGEPDRTTLERLQRAHVTTVPFETLAITGAPFGDGEGEGVCLDTETLYEKVVSRERGGFCFELNGAFGWLLAALGFDVTRVAARMVGAIELPANHHPLVVSLDEPYLVDVGMGSPMLRAPLPLGGAAPPDDAGVAWRLVDSARPDAEYCLRYREQSAAWEDRYVFDTTPRGLSYFAATCEYLATAPESGFTGDPSVTMATGDGWLRLTPETFSRTRVGETEEEPVDPGEYRERLASAFGIALDGRSRRKDFLGQ